MGWFGGKSSSSITSSQAMTKHPPSTQINRGAAEQVVSSKPAAKKTPVVESTSIAVQQHRTHSSSRPKTSTASNQTYEPPSTSALHSTKASSSSKMIPTPTISKDVDDESEYGGSNQLKNGETESQSDSVPKASYSYEQPTYAESEHQSVSQNHLNSLFNGHLMKWKYEAEEGTFFIRVPAFLGALAQIGVTIAAFVLNRPMSVEAHSIVMYVCILFMSLLVLILDGRFLSSHPLSIRSHLRNIATRNFNILRFLWGRGLLYLTIGVLSIGQMWIPTIIAGAVMCFVGILAVAVGVHASRKFAALRNSLADESFLLLVFANYDADADGYIDTREFAWLLVDLGVELDDRYTLKAFNSIDKDGDRLISFEEFSHWWSSGFVERGRKMYMDDDDSYRRMDERV